MIDGKKAKVLADFANSNLVPYVMTDLLLEIEKAATGGKYSLETDLLAHLEADELKVIEREVRKLGFTFETKQVKDCKDRVVIGWE